MGKSLFILDLFIRIMMLASFLFLILPQFKEIHQDMKEWSKWIKE